MPNSAQPDFYCSTAAREAEAPLFGTATEVAVWLCFEYTGTWAHKAFDESALGEAIKAHLNAARAAIPGARIQLIKQNPPYARDGLTFAVAVPLEADSALYVFNLSAPEELLALDIPAIARGDPKYDPYQSDALMFLICTNTRRDRCCGVRGIGTYRRLAQQLGTAAWRTTHLGGHRYAATGVLLPHGIAYGRLDDADPSELVRETRGGRVYLPALRGRSIYPPAAQAAEYYLRRETGITEIDAFRLEGVAETGGDQFEARFTESTGGNEHVVRVERRQSAAQTYASCGASAPEPVDEYNLKTAISG